MFMLYCGIIILVVGLIFKLFPPKKINRIYGWRTGFSMKNRDTWREAQRYGANLMIVGGLVSVLIGFLLSIVYEDMNMMIDVIAVLMILAFILFLGEKHLRSMFDKEGNRIDTKHQ